MDTSFMFRDRTECCEDRVNKISSQDLMKQWLIESGRICWQDILEQFAIRKEVWVGGREVADTHMTHVRARAHTHMNILEVPDVEHKGVR